MSSKFNKLHENFVLIEGGNEIKNYLDLNNYEKDKILKFRNDPSIGVEWSTAKLYKKRTTIDFLKA